MSKPTSGNSGAPCGVTRPPLCLPTHRHPVPHLRDGKEPECDQKLGEKQCVFRCAVRAVSASCEGSVGCVPHVCSDPAAEHRVISSHPRDSVGENMRSPRIVLRSFGLRPWARQQASRSAGLENDPPANALSSARCSPSRSTSAAPDPTVNSAHRDSLSERNCWSSSCDRGNASEARRAEASGLERNTQSELRGRPLRPHQQRRECTRESQQNTISSLPCMIRTCADRSPPR